MKMEPPHLKGTLQTCLSTAWGGLEMVALEVALKMKANGHPIVTVCVPGSPLETNLTQAGLETIPVRRRNKYFCLSTLRVIRRALQSGRFSAVLVEQMNELWQVVPALIAMPEIRLVGISHTFVGIHKKDLLHRWLYGRVNYLIALTGIHKTNLLEHLPVREGAIAVLPNAVDLTKFNPSRRSLEFRKRYLKADHELLLGVVSRLDMNKGLVEVVQVAEVLSNQKIPFRLIIAGKETANESGTHARLANEILSRGLSEKVFLVGHCPDIATVMASLDILLMPSPTETFGRVLIEAMASGTAVVASSGGGVPDIIQNGIDGILVPPLAIPEMAEAAGRIALDAAERERLARAGRQSASDRYDERKLDLKLYAMLGLS